MLVGRLVEAAVTLILASTLAASRLLGLAPRASWRPNRRVLVIGTFYNTAWFVSHVRPLAESGLEEVVVVTDEPVVSLARVRFACPPRWLVGLVGRPLARAWWAIREALGSRPDLVMGYHIVPNSLIALLAGRLAGRLACYQMTGGPIEIEGGGIASENSWLIRLGRPSSRLERLALRVIAEFDLVVVRGSSARAFLAERGHPGPIAIVPGSVAPAARESDPERVYDLIYVGRFTETKRPLAFVEVAAGVAARFPGLRAVMLGDGPLLEEARDRIRGLGLSAQVELRGRELDVDHYLARSRVFVLTSRSEGLSIAMAEAMAAGVTPVVSRVGDLADLVRDGENGHLVDAGDVEGFTDRVAGLLEDPERLERLSAAARADALAHAGLPGVTSRWSSLLDSLVQDRVGPDAARPGGG